MALVGVVIGGILLITAVDFFSGSELRVFPLYYLPISLAAWSFGRTGAVAAAVLSAIGWRWSKQLAGLEFSLPVIWVANTLVQGTSFTFVGLLMASLRRSLSHERALSRMDALCPLLNSRSFYKEGDRLLALCRRNKRPITLASIDLDNFKAVNDTLGHKAGDEFLLTVAQVLLSSIRASDLAARLGGDEFAIMLPEAGPDQSRWVLERIRGAICQAASDLPSAVSVSVGAVTDMTSRHDLGTMIQMADTIMYSVKTDGKNRVHLEVIGNDTAMGLRS